MERRRAIQSARDEIILQPESSGQYTYEFTHIVDEKYRSKIPLTGSGRTITQTVHPRASAEFVRNQQSMGRQALSSCSGNEVKVDVDLRVSLRFLARHAGTLVYELNGYFPGHGALVT